MVTVGGVFVFTNPIVWYVLGGATQYETHCLQGTSKCVVVLSVRTNGLDYTTTSYLFWGSEKHDLEVLPDHYVQFDPEVVAEPSWQENGVLHIRYEGGGLNLVGEIPPDFNVKFVRSDG